MMYNKILSRSFGRNEKKRLGYGAIGSLVMAFCIWVLFKLYLCRLSALSLQMSMDSGVGEKLVIKNTSISRHLVAKGERKELKPICSILEPRLDSCEITGDIRVHGKSSTVSVPSLQTDTLVTKDSRNMKPYTRKDNAVAMKLVRNWSVNLVSGHKQIPSCNLNHNVPAILFSLGGFSGNHFHDFSDLVIPLYITSQQFNGEVQFLVTDYKPWWISRFKRILEKLSKYEIINIDRDENIHCFSRIIIGLRFHKELGIDPSKSPTGLSMKDFRQFLRSTYSLKKAKAIRLPQDDKDRRPRLLIISRRKSRAFENIDRISKTARILGYQVVVAEANLSTDMSKFSQLVNSCDVLMGVHGAGLTNMVYLPDNAILIQIVPLGEIDGLARDDFRKPSAEMNIRYLEYKIRVKESSLMKQYRLDHAVFRDPLSVHKQGWSAVDSIYLQKQNVKLDVHRFRATLSKALDTLRE
ncbi:protein O-linked-mannose beta-1,4-N-acetylglucosaminyltransferase 2-like [Melia azedarach]|uniref:Protein O-linked-mannose beta-1,4-N-acetylglucosaminyltransferase 2-like n=1 Tax=Melia azedarach TaxID=155640 RepID=A0ACC1XQP3_MELAZ|nr:protein O-linked-mannose beta-1,4-N-acetylglucosaminyltransferase 2-like [Melia azedarach]